jgi:hypothetical protein
LAGQTVSFGIGTEIRKAVTDATGLAKASLQLLQTPHDDTLRVVFGETTNFLGTDISAPFSITKQGTQLSISPTATTVTSGTATPFVATLSDASADHRVLREQSVFFVLTGGGQAYATTAITDFAGRAPLPNVPLPAGTYTLAASFGGTIALGNGQTVTQSNDRFQPSSASATLTLLTGGDTTPPITTAAVAPTPNAAGWNNANVAVTLTATDNATGAAGVKQITYGASGAQPIGTTTVNGATAAINITTEGQTTIAFASTDKAGNTETQKTTTVKLDKTPPTLAISGVINGITYDNTVTPSVQIQDLNTGGNTDGTSGVDVSKTVTSVDGQQFQSGTPVTAIGPHTLNVSATDLAGNTASASVGFRVKHASARSRTPDLCPETTTM